MKCKMERIRQGQAVEIKREKMHDENSVFADKNDNRTCLTRKFPFGTLRNVTCWVNIEECIDNDNIMGQRKSIFGS